MKISCHKISAGFIPATDMESEQIESIPNGAIIELEYKLSRNYQFHKKVFLFLNYCFAHWKSDREFLSERKQFDYFRERLMILAGYYDEFFDIDGTVNVKAQSLSYGNMDESEFRSCYTALINAAMAHIFHNCDDSIYDELIGFF